MESNGKEAKRGGVAVEPLIDGGKAYPPDVDIVEDQGSLFLYLDLPGVGPGQAQVELDENDILTIRAQGAAENPGTELLRQFPTGPFYRAFQLGAGYDRDRIRAEMADGTLTLTIPRKEAPKPKIIPIGG